MHRPATPLIRIAIGAVLAAGCALTQSETAAASWGRELVCHSHRHGR
jgi:hypothetical protein